MRVPRAFLTFLVILAMLFGAWIFFGRTVTNLAPSLQVVSTQKILKGARPTDFLTSVANSSVYFWNTVGKSKELLFSGVLAIFGVVIMVPAGARVVHRCGRNLAQRRRCDLRRRLLVCLPRPHRLRVLPPRESETVQRRRRADCRSRAARLGDAASGVPDRRGVQLPAHGQPARRRPGGAQPFISPPASGVRTGRALRRPPRRLLRRPLHLRHAAQSVRHGGAGGPARVQRRSRGPCRGPALAQIGRASCRERVAISGGDGSC